MLQEFIAHANLAEIPFPNSAVDLDIGDFGFVAVAKDVKENCPAGFRSRRSEFFDEVLGTLRVPAELLADLSHQLRDHFEQFKNGWPYLTNFTMRNSVAALAQHHGIPTRLLDWTHDGRKAAFFAAASVAHDTLENQAGTIAVYGLNPFMMRTRFVSEWELEAHVSCRNAVELFLSTHSLFTERSYTSSYLAAQDGLFTYPEYADLYHVFTGEYPTIDNSMERMALWRAENPDKNWSNPPIRDFIRKVTLPYSELDNLMDLLDDERIMLTTLMPNLDRLKECILMRGQRRKRQDVSGRPKSST